MKRNKSLLEISFDNFYSLVKWRNISIALVGSSLILWTIDNTLDFTIYLYVTFLASLTYFLVGIYKRRLIKDYVRDACILEKENIAIRNDSIVITLKDNITSILKKECTPVHINDFLFIEWRSWIINDSLTSKLFVLTGEQKELKIFYNLLLDTGHFKKKYKGLITIVLFFISFLLLAWKIDIHILNKYTYKQNGQWKIESINKFNGAIIIADSLNLNYLGLKNNFTDDTSTFFSNRFFIHYRHEPFDVIKLLYGSGQENNTIESLIKDKFFLGKYEFKYYGDKLKIENDNYKITCIRKL